MAEGQKLIGVCLSEAHSVLNTGFLAELNSAAAAQGYSVVLFNSTPNPYRPAGEADSRALYRAIRFSLYDAIVIIYYSFRDRGLLEEIVSGARRRRVPVISLGEALPGCYSICNEYEESYTALLRHVLADHGATDTVFLAGHRLDDTSALREACYRRALESCGLPFDPARVLPAGYDPARARALLTDYVQARRRRGENPPRAVFCANDDMAVAACDALKALDLRVPGDVLVTGFDGIPAAFMASPRLSTCCDDPKGAAGKVLEIVSALRSGSRPPLRSAHRFRVVRSESCGCPAEENRRFDALTLFRRSEALARHENDLSLRASILAAEPDPAVFWQKLSLALLPDSVLYVHRSFLDASCGRDDPAAASDTEAAVLAARAEGDPFSMPSANIRDLRPHDASAPATYVLNAVYAGGRFCGVYSAATHDPEGDAQLIRRMSDMLSLLFSLRHALDRQQALIRSLDDTLYRDAATGLHNLRGLSRWFAAFSADPAGHDRPLSLTVYSISHYSWLFETYGTEEVASVVSLAASRLAAAHEGALALARISDEQFVAVHAADTPAALRRLTDSCQSRFLRSLETHNAAASRPYYVEVSHGSTLLDAHWQDAALESLIHLALGEMYLNNMRSEGVSRAAGKTPSASSAAHFSAFNLLMEKDLLSFHYQPILSAKTARIVAYEALMRADPLVSLSPLEILAVAREYHRLDELEKRTLFGIIQQYVQDPGAFSGCRVFINTIPGHFLPEEDCRELERRYEGFLHHFVFELTEQDTTPDEELARLRSLGREDRPTQIAIDDYGTGHSNMVNVLRYAPQIIKIDRELISNIHADANRQLFVRNTIDFAHRNHIEVLAEGVETAEELRAVIDYGVDYIQGFFTGRPAARPQKAAADAVRNLILGENLALRRQSRAGTVHTAAPGEEVDVVARSIEGVSCVMVPGGRVTLTGRAKQPVPLSVQVPDGAEAVLVLRGVRLSAAGEPAVTLGNGASLTLVLEGENLLDKEGILVPASARLTLRGSGSLRIEAGRNFAVGVGADFNDPFGTLVLDLDEGGSLSVSSSGDRFVCLGGGRSAGEGIRFLRGNYSFRGSGITTLGVGAAGGDAKIDIGPDASVTLSLECNETVGLGTLSGDLDFRCAGTLSATLKCERGAGVGTLSGSGHVAFTGGRASVTARCERGACVGSYDGEVSVLLGGADVTLHGEGNRVAALGSVEGACDARIEGGRLRADILAAECLLLGNAHSRAVVTGGNVLLAPDPPAGKRGAPVSPAGLPLHCLRPEGPRYEKSFRDKRESWTYTADRDAEGNLAVWIPNEENS